MKKILLVIAILLTISGCADTVTFEQAAIIEPVGFWYGFWHGMTFAFSFIGSLFSDDIAIYAIYNNGGWYDFGFWAGIGTLSGSAASAKK